jgi:Sec-independent protein secretion pathway component TatC
MFLIQLSTDRLLTQQAQIVPYPLALNRIGSEFDYFLTLPDAIRHLSKIVMTGISFLTSKNGRIEHVSRLLLTLGKVF